MYTYSRYVKCIKSIFFEQIDVTKIDTIETIAVFFPAKIEGVGEGIILCGASVHIKDFGSTPILLQRQISTEGMGPPIP